MQLAKGEGPIKSAEALPLSKTVEYQQGSATQPFAQAIENAHLTAIPLGGEPDLAPRAYQRAITLPLETSKIRLTK